VSAPEAPSKQQGVYDVWLYEFIAEVDPGTPERVESLPVVVRVTFTNLWELAGGDPREREYAERGGRVAWHIVCQKIAVEAERLRMREKLVITVDSEEYKGIDPARVMVEPKRWFDLQPSGGERRECFISCGQQTAEERGLGEQIAALVREKTGYGGYFAQQQTSLEGVSKHIFEAIHSADAFIAVMHRRDVFNDRDAEYRGSVWVEQEIAIAAFMQQALGRGMPARAYVQRHIRMEGVRGFILLNPIEFESSEDVLNDLEQWLPVLLKPGKATAETVLRPEQELEIIKAASSHYKKTGELMSLLSSLSISARDKRRLHQVSVNVVRRERGQEEYVVPGAKLEEYYPE
jgi:hypothetical protein